MNRSPPTDNVLLHKSCPFRGFPRCMPVTSKKHPYPASNLQTLALSPQIPPHKNNKKIRAENVVYLSKTIGQENIRYEKYQIISACHWDNMGVGHTIRVAPVDTGDSVAWINSEQRLQI